MENKAGLRALAEHFPAWISEIAALENEIGSSFFPYSKALAARHSVPDIESVIAGQASSTGEAWACMSHFGKCE